MLEHSRLPIQALDISQVLCSEVNEFLAAPHRSGSAYERVTVPDSSLRG